MMSIPDLIKALQDMNPDAILTSDDGHGLVGVGSDGTLYFDHCEE